MNVIDFDETTDYETTQTKSEFLNQKTLSFDETIKKNVMKDKPPENFLIKSMEMNDKYVAESIALNPKFIRFSELSDSGEYPIFMAFKKKYINVVLAILSRTDVDCGINLLDSNGKSILYWIYFYYPTHVLKVIKYPEFKHFTNSRSNIGYIIYDAFIYRDRELILSIFSNKYFTDFTIDCKDNTEDFGDYTHHECLWPLALAIRYRDDKIINCILERKDVNIGINKMD